MDGFSDVNRVNRTLNYMESMGRLIETIRLYKRGQVGKIFISGDFCCIDPVLLFNYTRDLGVPDSVFNVSQN